ncbi:Flagellar motor switch protein FliN [Pirellulimonas nuda]|uniref:Flagellar motor switch protein FliN n=1 Tax=Pirellulimonas nuda TaxID=2528009 RepID=A0A518D9Q8_9BACT|nr:flagellar motor switch protein FliN [Pirellulimonas nuda]QDU88222.1 Flagellar motor switch protein FliN [Pirellulimonas nuda]
MAGESDQPESVATDHPPQGDRSAAAQTEVEALISAAAAAGAADAQSSDLDLLLQKAEAAIASLDEPSGELPSGVRPFDLQEFGGTPANMDAATLELVRDVELDLKIELGRTDMNLEDVLRLKRGSVVTLDKLAGDPVDVIVNGRLVARGEVLVLNDNFCVRVTELIVGESAVA